MVATMLRRRALNLPPVEGPRRGRATRVALGCLLGCLVAGTALTMTAAPGGAAVTAPASPTAVAGCKAAPRALKTYQAQARRSTSLLAQLRTALAQAQRQGRRARATLLQARILQLQQYHDNIAASITELQQRCGHTAR